MIFIAGDQCKLTPIVDTALKQYCCEKNRPLLRVEIIDFALDSARELLAKFPLFLPLLKKNSCPATLNFAIIAQGDTCPHLLREAKWFMTFPAELQITTKITRLLCVNDDVKGLTTLIEEAAAKGEEVYFAVDTGDDLRTLSLAIQIRTLITRAWLKYSDAKVPRLTR